MIWLRKIRLSGAFILFYLYDLSLAALRIAWDTLTIRDLSKPGFVWFPLDCKTDKEITLFAHLVSFSPGSMVVDLSEDKKKILIHAMFIESEDTFIKETKEKLEKRVLEIFR